MQTTHTLTISGMTCQNCVRHVTNALKSVPNLTVNEVGIGTAVVSYDPATVTDENVLAVLRDAGYSAQISA